MGSIYDDKGKARNKLCNELMELYRSGDKQQVFRRLAELRRGEGIYMSHVLYTRLNGENWHTPFSGIEFMSWLEAKADAGL